MECEFQPEYAQIVNEGPVQKLAVLIRKPALAVLDAKPVHKHACVQILGKVSEQSQLP